MTQSIESMIKVLQAFKDKKKVGFIDADNEFVEIASPAWDFSSTNYVVAPEPKNKVKLEAWLMRGELRWFDDTSTVIRGLSEKVRVPSEDKEVLL